MFLDKQNEFSDGQLITATAISTNVIDTHANTEGGATKDLGTPAGVPLFLVVQTDVALSGGTATGLVFSLESDSTANLATSPTVHYSSGTIATASLGAGLTLAVIPLPSGEYERYLGVRYTPQGGSYAAGSVSAFLTRDPGTWRPYYTASASNL